MVTEKRLIDANALFPGKMIAVNIKNPMETVEDLINRINNAQTVDAVPTNEIKLRYIGINDYGIAKITLQLGNRFLDLFADAFDVRKVVHGRWENHKCTSCGCAEPGYYDHIEDCIVYKPTVFCPNCGAKMDGDGNG